MGKKDKIKEIQELYGKLDNKMDFLHVLASKTGKNFKTLKNHHFSCNWKIPEKYHDMYISELNRVLKHRV